MFNVLTPEEEYDPLNEKSSFKLKSSVEYNISDIVKMIKNIDEVEEKELKRIIMKQHKTILNYDLFLSNSNTREAAQFLFTNNRFLKIFLDVIGLIQPNSHEITCINKLMYDYHISDNKNSETESLLFEISTVINSNTVVKLSPYLGFNGAKLLAIIANSSFSQEKNIKRINNFIMKCNMEMDVHRIICIFCILYNRFSYPFLYSMMQEKPSNLDDEELKRFDYISIALLSILHSMTNDDIHTVLLNYGTELKINPCDKVRFSIKSANQYSRIVDIAKYIEENESVKIP